jgi:hypothetical protein
MLHCDRNQARLDIQHNKTDFLFVFLPVCRLYMLFVGIVSFPFLEHVSRREKHCPLCPGLGYIH